MLLCSFLLNRSEKSLYWLQTLNVESGYFSFTFIPPSQTPNDIPYPGRTIPRPHLPPHTTDALTHNLFNPTWRSPPLCSAHHLSLTITPSVPIELDDGPPHRTHHLHRPLAHEHPLRSRSERLRRAASRPARLPSPAAHPAHPPHLLEPVLPLSADDHALGGASGTKGAADM